MVVPALDEEAGIRACIDAVARVLAPSGLAWELVLVDDGSRDRTWELMRAHAPPGSVLVRMAGRAGQQAALRTGLAHARGAARITYDADMQNAPECLPELARRVLAGSPLVSGLRWPRAEGLVRALPSRVGQGLVNLALGVRQSDFGSVKAYSAQLVDRLLALPPEDLILPAAAFAMAGRFEEVRVAHAPRRTGESKWPLWRRVALLAQIRDSVRTARAALPGPAQPLAPVAEVVRT